MSTHDAWLQLPRVNELRSINSGTTHHYFDQNPALEPVGARWSTWSAREGHLQNLDAAAWEFLKDELAKKLVQKDPLRGWQQLISSLNESFAYSYLSSAGYKTIQFISRSITEGVETPDLRACSPWGKETVCEVKTIHRSDVEIQKQQMANEKLFYGATGTSSSILEDGFYNKLFSDIDKAVSQCKAYAAEAEHFVFIVINFDDWTGDNDESYFTEIDRRLGEIDHDATQLILCNMSTPLHPKIQMKNAELVHWEDY